jgi:hypothetical protein
MANLCGVQEFTSTVSSTVTFPPGVVCYQVEAWGAGGGGGGGGGTSGSSGSGGGAGGSGGYVRAIQATTSGSVTIGVGAGGSGGAAGANGGQTGGNGGSTTVAEGGSVVITAPGGSGGSGGASTSPPGSATPGGAGGPAGSVPGGQGITRQGPAGGAANGVNGGGAGGYPGAGTLPALPNTGGGGGRGSSAAFGSTPASGPTNGGSGAAGSLLLSWYVLIPWPSGGQRLQAYSGGPAQGQTIDGLRSYVYLECGGAAVTAHVKLTQTNQPNARFHIYYKLDGGAPIDSGVYFGTDGQGDGAVNLTITSLAAGAHALLVEINNVQDNNTYYITADPNGIRFSC